MQVRFKVRSARFQNSYPVFNTLEMCWLCSQEPLCPLTEGGGDHCGCTSPLLGCTIAAWECTVCLVTPLAIGLGIEMDSQSVNGPEQNLPLHIVKLFYSFAFLCLPCSPSPNTVDSILPPPCPLFFPYIHHNFKTIVSCNCRFPCLSYWIACVLNSWRQRPYFLSVCNLCPL